MLRFLGLVGALALAFIVPASAQSARAPLELFYGYDQVRFAELSPNGQNLALVRRDATGDILTVVNLQTRQSRAIQTARAEHMMEFIFVDWKTDDRLLFGVAQKIHVVASRTSVRTGRDAGHTDDGFEWVFRVYATGADGSNLISLYDPSGAQGFPREISAGLVSTLPHDDDHVLMRVPDYNGAKLWRVNVRDGSHTEVEAGGYWTGGWVVDINGTPVLRQDYTNNGRGWTWSRRGPGQRTWTEVARFTGADAANTAPTFQGLDAAIQPGQVFVVARREGDDTSGLYIYDTATGQYSETVQRNTDFDVYDGIFDRKGGTVLAACWWAYRWTCEPKEQEFGRRWRGLQQALGDQVNVRLIGRGGDNGERWLLQTSGPQDLGTYWLYDANARSLNKVLTTRQDVDPALLPTSRVVHYTASDGRELWGYLWIPPGVTNVHNLPLIVVPHGGPEGRDTWGGDPFSVVFASRGYAVFEPNFRGGSGSGRAFVEAGHGQWGRRMQEDVADGTRYLFAQGIADPQRTCIMGWSYGGYVAFTASFMNTDIYKCSVAGAGVSDLNAMQRWERAGSHERDVISGGGSGSSSISYRYWQDAIGEEGAALDRYSAAQNAARVTIPLLMIHGDEDQTVPYEQSEIMQRAMERAGKQVRLVTLHDTEHHFTPDQGEAWRTVFDESLAFFNQNIGPGVEPGSQ